MNPKNLLLAVTVAASLLSASVLSATVVIEPAGLTDGVMYTSPVVVKTVNPTGISRRFQGEIVRLGFTIDEQGQPRNIALLSGRDPNLVRHLLPAVAQWRFTPAMKNGRAVSADVVLPIQLVDGPAS